MANPPTRVLRKAVAIANVAGEIVPVDHNGAYPLAGWEIEGSLHGVVPVLSPTEPLPKSPGLYIYNTRSACETSPKSPGHWVAASIPTFPSSHIEFFDSFGRPPSAYGLESVFDQSKEIFYNPVKLQESGTFSCGHYVIAYCAFHLVGWSMDDFLGLFNPTNPRENDCIAVELASPMVRRLARSFSQ